MRRVLVASTVWLVAAFTACVNVISDNIFIFYVCARNEVSGWYV